MRIGLSGLACYIVIFVLGGAWNALAMPDFYAANAPASARAPEEQSLLAIALGYLAITVFMTFLFSQSFKSAPGAAAGFQFGALFGLIATLPLYLILYGVWDISLSYILVDSGWHLAEEGIGGIVLALTMYPAVERGSDAG